MHQGVHVAMAVGLGLDLGALGGEGCGTVLEGGYLQRSSVRRFETGRNPLLPGGVGAC